MTAIKAAFERIGEENAFAVLARAAELQRQGRDIINLGIGQPDFKTPPHIVEAAVKALRDGEHGYTDATGIAPLREAVAEDLHRRLGADVSPDLIMIVPGGKVTMFMAIEMFGEKGVDIVYPDPGFPIYRSMIEFTGARPIPIPMREENGFAFSADEALALMTPETRLIILNSPANPTGGVTPKEEIDKLVAGLARFPNAAILSDEIYGQLTYDGLAHQTLLAYPEIRDRLILLDGWSKTYAMTGWRLGYSVWPKPWRDVARKLAVNSYSCVNCVGAIRGHRGAQGSAGFGRDDAGGIRPAAQGGHGRPQSAARRERRDAQGRVLRFSQCFPHRLEGQAPRLGVVAGCGRGHDRRPGLRRLWRGVLAALLRQLARKYRARARADRGLSQPPRARGGGLVTRSFLSSLVIKVIMRSLVFAAAAIAFCPLAQAEDAHPSQAACDAAKIGARELADCLRTSADRVRQGARGGRRGGDQIDRRPPGPAIVAKVPLAPLAQ